MMNIEDLYNVSPWYCDEAERILKDPVIKKEAEKVMAFLQYYFPSYFPKPAPHLHIEMLQLAIGGKNVALAVPRSHSKSTLLTFGLNIYKLVFLEFKYSLIASESLDKAQGFVERIRDELEFNHKLIQEFAPEKFKTTNWAKGDFVTQTRRKVDAIGYGQSGRGHIFEDSRPDMVFYDDLETTENAGEQKMKDKFDSDLYPAIARNNPDSKRCYVGTIINDTSLLHDTMHDERWVRARYESLLESAQDKEIDDITDEDMLAPMLYNAEDYRKDRKAMEKKGKLSIFMAENHNNPTIKDESAVFTKDMLSYYNFDDIRKHIPSMNIYMSIDPAISKNERADYTVITTIAVNSDNVWFVLNQKWGRYSTYETAEQIFNEAKKFKPQLIVFETIAYQQSLKEHFEAEMIRKNSYFRTDVTTKQNKEVKIQKLEPRYRQKTVKHPKNDTTFVPQLERQLLGFRPELPKFGLAHDDMIDSLSMLCDFATPPSDYSTNSEEYIAYEEEEYVDPCIID